MHVLERTAQLRAKERRPLDREAADALQQAEEVTSTDKLKTKVHIKLIPEGVIAVDDEGAWFMRELNQHISLAQSLLDCVRPRTHESFLMRMNLSART